LLVVDSGAGAQGWGYSQGRGGTVAVTLSGTDCSAFATSDPSTIATPIVIRLLRNVAALLIDTALSTSRKHATLYESTSYEIFDNPVSKFPARRSCLTGSCRVPAMWSAFPIKLTCVTSEPT
jgi:hypothetical protein